MSLALVAIRIVCNTAPHPTPQPANTTDWIRRRQDKLIYGLRYTLFNKQFRNMKICFCVCVILLVGYMTQSQ